MALSLTRKAAAPVRAARGRKAFKVEARDRGIVTKRGVAFAKDPVEDPEPEDISTVDKALIALGLPCNAIALWSEVTLVQTGGGLPPGPGGALGAIEGISYLVVPGIVAYSLYTKVKTGSGLPPGPAGLLGATEGISFLTLLGALAAFGYQVATRGSVPGVLG